MDAGIIQIFGTRYYTTGFGLIFVLPFALWFLASMMRFLMLAIDKEPTKWKRVVIAFGCMLAVMIIVFWDVYQIGQQATRLCNEKAGMHVYRTAEAESVLGLSSIERWSKYGFKFVEYESRMKEKTRQFLKDGKPAYKIVDNFLSQYELVTTRPQITPKIQIIRMELKDRQTNDVLGESIEYSINGGWADMLFYGFTGFSYSPWICSGENKRPINPSDLVRATLKPISKPQ